MPHKDAKKETIGSRPSSHLRDIRMLHLYLAYFKYTKHETKVKEGGGDKNVLY